MRRVDHPVVGVEHDAAAPAQYRMSQPKRKSHEKMGWTPWHDQHRCRLGRYSWRLPTVMPTTPLASQTQRWNLVMRDCGCERVVQRAVQVVARAQRTTRVTRGARTRSEGTRWWRRWWQRSARWSVGGVRWV